MRVKHDVLKRGSRRKGNVPATEVRSQLARILESDAFKRSGRLAAFLQYIVNRQLRSAEPIREVDLALDVFQRGAEFDSRTDPIVRVEGGRLRKALSAYYDTDGAEDTVLIALPARGYTPRYDWRKNGLRSPGARAGDAQRHSSIRTSARGPSIAVLPFLNMTNDQETDVLCQGVTEELINALTRIDDFRVVSRTSAFQFKDRAVDLRSIGKQLGAETVVEGSIRTDGERLRVTAQLSSAEDGFHLWSQTFDAVLTDPFRVEENLGREMSTAIAELLHTA